jgi:hypothetical protein
VSPNDNFKRELNNVFDDVSGAPSANLRDRVRSAIDEAPAQRSTYWIAAAAAILITALIVGVLYVNNPFRRPGTVGGNSTPSPATTPSPMPSPSPSPSPSQQPYICTADTVPQGTPKATPIAYVNDVRIAEHDADGYERIVIQFANGLPAEFVELTPRSSTTFTENASGKPITVKGSNGILVRIHGADMHTSYSGKTDWVTGFKTLAEVRVLEDFEGVINLALGINGQACYRAQYFTDPARLVIDVQVAS